ncbi:MAG: hypothetical protein KM296_00205 [Brockia lithotrophica]|nr:hypothetical protein [Brockia lithotrophica]
MSILFVLLVSSFVLVFGVAALYLFVIYPRQQERKKFEDYSTQTSDEKGALPIETKGDRIRVQKIKVQKELKTEDVFPVGVLKPTDYPGFFQKGKQYLAYFKINPVSIDNFSKGERAIFWEKLRSAIINIGVPFSLYIFPREVGIQDVVNDFERRAFERKVIRNERFLNNLVSFFRQYGNVKSFTYVIVFFISGAGEEIKVSRINQIQIWAKSVTDTKDFFSVEPLSFDDVKELTNYYFLSNSGEKANQK